MHPHHPTGPRYIPIPIIPSLPPSHLALPIRVLDLGRREELSRVRGDTEGETKVPAWDQGGAVV